MQSIELQIDNAKEMMIYFERNNILKSANDMQHIIKSLEKYKEHYANSESQNIIISFTPEQYKQFLERITEF